MNRRAEGYLADTAVVPIKNAHQSPRRLPPYVLSPSANHAEGQPPTLLPVIPDGIPASLRARPQRWAPWQKVWKPKKSKYDKVPCDPSSLRNTSTDGTWWGFDVALAAYKRGAPRGKSAGVGFNMKKDDGLVGVDLDRCVDAGVLEPWAKEVVGRLGSYTEFSPSGRGVRVFLAGDIAEDWTNHPQGLEVYAGHQARFLTVTGHHVAGTPKEVQRAPAGAITWLEGRHKPVKDRSPVRLTEMPAILAADALPTIEDLDLPGAARDFLLSEGEPFGDESHALAVATLALYDATATDDGELRDDVVLSVLVHNAPALEVATRHRPRSDDDSAHAAAVEYLWVHHCLKMKAKASPRSGDDFDEWEEDDGPGAGGGALALPLVGSTVVPAPPSEAPPADAAQPVADAEAPAGSSGEGEGEEKPRQASDLEYVDFTTLAHTRPPPRRWTVEQWLAAGTVTSLFGPPGVGKSLNAQQLAIAVANGEPWLGLQTTRGPVIGLFCEDDANELMRRALRIFEAGNCDVAQWCAGLHLDARAGKPNALVDFANDRVARRSRLMRKLQEQCVLLRPELVILDNIAQLFTGVENDRGQVTSFCNLLTGLALEHDCAVLLLGHPAKAQGSEFSGSTAWEAAVRTRLFLERQKDGTLALSKAKANYSAIDKIALEYKPPGVFAPFNSEASAGAELVTVEEAKPALMHAVDVYTRRKRSTSHVPTTRNFIVKLMADDGLLGGITRPAATKALGALIDSGQLVPGSVLGWRSDDRKTIYGLAPGVAAPGVAAPGVNDA